MANVRPLLIEGEIKDGEFKKPDQDGMTPLMNAVRKGDSASIDFLLEIKESKLVRDPGLQVEDKKGMTALMHAAAIVANNPDEAKTRETINRQLIHAIHFQKNILADKLAEFEQVMPVIVESNNGHFFQCLMAELIIAFFAKDNQLPELLILFINDFLQRVIVKNRPDLVACVKPWIESLKKHPTTKELLSKAVKARSGAVAAMMIEQDFFVEQSLFTDVLRQEFIGENKEQSIKKMVLNSCDKKYVCKLTIDDFKAALPDKNLLKMLLSLIFIKFSFGDLIEAWNYDFAAVVDFWIDNGFDANFIDAEGFHILTYGLQNKNFDFESKLKGTKKLLDHEAQVLQQTISSAMTCNDERLIKLLEKNIKKCGKEAGYVINFDPQHKLSWYDKKIWKYLGILLFLVKHDKKIMHYKYEQDRDAWSYIFENYKNDLAKATREINPEDVYALVEAAKKTNQLKISDKAIQFAIESGDRQLVELLVRVGNVKLSQQDQKRFMQASNKAKPAEAAQKTEKKEEKKAEEPRQELRAKLCLAARREAKNQDTNRQLIQKILHQNNSPESKFAELEQVIPSIVETYNIDFFECLMSELEKLFPIKENKLTGPLLSYVNRFLQAALIKNRGDFVGYMFALPWAPSLKENNPNLLLDAIQLRSGAVVRVLIKQDVIPNSKPSVLTQILRQEFLGDNNRKVKEDIIKFLAEKNYKITREDLKEAFLNKDLLRCVIYAFHEMLSFDDLLAVFRNDVCALTDFWMKRVYLELRFKHDSNLLENLFTLFYNKEKERDYILPYIEKLVTAGLIIKANSLSQALECNDRRMINIIEERTTDKNFNRNDKSLYSNNFFNSNCDSYSAKIWKYPRILLSLIQAGNEKIMCGHAYGFFSRDAWYSVFEQYQENINERKPNAQKDILDLVTAAAEAQPKQLMISDDAFKLAVKTGDIQLVKLLVTNGAKITEASFELSLMTGNPELVMFFIEKNEKLVKKESSVFSASTLEKAAKLGYFDLVKQLLLFPNLLWPQESIKAASEACPQGSLLRQYLSAVWLYAKITIVPDTIPGRDLRDRADLIHLLIAKYQFNEAKLKDYQSRFGEAIQEYQKLYRNNVGGLEHKAEEKNIQTVKRPNAPVYASPQPVVVRANGDLDGVNPVAEVKLNVQKIIQEEQKNIRQEGLPEGAEGQPEEVIEGQCAPQQPIAVVPNGGQQNAESSDDDEQDELPVNNNSELKEGGEPLPQQPVIGGPTSLIELNFFQAQPVVQNKPLSQVEVAYDAKVAKKMYELSQMMQADWVGRHPKFQLLHAWLKQCALETDPSQAEAQNHAKVSKL